MSSRLTDWRRSAAALLTGQLAAKLGRFRKETSAKSNAMKIVPYTVSEANQLFAKAAACDFDLYVFLLTAVLAGMRLGEVIGLQWDDIDFGNMRIMVKRAVSRRRIETPKSHQQRPIDLADDLCRALQELRRRRKEEWFEKGLPMPAWVFCNEDGNFINEYNLRTRKFYPLFKKVEGQEQLRRICLHNLRHTFASMHLQNGESIVWVKDQMGHYSIQITVDMYGHLLPGANRAAANRLAATLNTSAVVVSA